MWLKKRLGKNREESETYDHKKRKPLIRASICTGEKVAGFQNLETGKFEEVMLLRNEEDLKRFRDRYQITEEIRKEW